MSERKSWEFTPEERAEINRRSAEVAAQYRKGVCSPDTTSDSGDDESIEPRERDLATETRDNEGVEKGGREGGGREM